MAAGGSLGFFVGLTAGWLAGGSMGWPPVSAMALGVGLGAVAWAAGAAGSYWAVRLVRGRGRPPAAGPEADFDDRPPPAG
jgi:hypothetical protein